MSTSSSKHTVFVLGGTGTTGSSVVNGLLNAGKYVRHPFDLLFHTRLRLIFASLKHVIVGVRPLSFEKPEVSKLRERGVGIRAVELTSTQAELDAALKGVDTVICTTHFTEIDKQASLVDAAKRAGVKRFAPDDWASPCVRGVMKVHDQV